MFSSNSVTKLKIPRSYRKIEHLVTTTFNTGDFVPFFNMEIIPNDKISLDIKTVTNMTTPNYATMDTLQQDIAFFFVPNTIVWDSFKEFYGEGKTNDYTPFVQKFVPQMTCPSGGWAEGTIADYLGIPTGINCHKTSALPFRGIAMIYKEYYRDEQRMAIPLISKGDADQTGTNGNNYVNDLQNGGKVPKVCKLWDYFTGTKLEFQAGAPITIPVGNEAPVYGKAGEYMHLAPEGNYETYGNHGLQNTTNVISTDPNFYNVRLGPTPMGDYQSFLNITAKSTTNTETGVYADLTQATGVDIPTFKRLLMAQQELQNIEDGGSRYIEQLYKRWGIYVNELELTIPKFLGYQKTILNMAMVLATGDKRDANSPYNFGDITGASNTYTEGNIFTYRFKQHGYLFGIVCIRPHNTYENGIYKGLVKESIDDYYKPEMAYLGPTEVKNYEIYSDSSDGKDDNMFGVRNYGDDLRFLPNRVTGQMRANSVYSQAYKTYSINYSQRPLNNQTFIEQNVNQVDKTLTKTSAVMHQFTFQARVILKMVRNIPKNPQAEQLIRL